MLLLEMIYQGRIEARVVADKHRRLEASGEWSGGPPPENVEKPDALERRFPAISQAKRHTQNTHFG
jgi:hypothetical protein